jgi:F0F1-type ATP synthase membrane subunit b/b'
VPELQRAIAEAEKAAKELKEQLKHAKAVVEETREKLNRPVVRRPARDRRH